MKTEDKSNRIFGDEKRFSSVTTMENLLRVELARLYLPYRIGRSGELRTFEIGEDTLPIRVVCALRDDCYRSNWGAAEIEETADPRYLAETIADVVRGKLSRFEICRGLDIIFAGLCLFGEEREIAKRFSDMFETTDDVRVDGYRYIRGRTISVPLSEVR